VGVYHSALFLLTTCEREIELSKIGKCNLFGGFQSPKMRETDFDILFSVCSEIKEGS
jgi:hypothetical protein